MKNSIMLLGFLLLLAHSLVAQISLDSMGYPETEIGTDSLKVTTASSAFPSFAPMVSGSWDMNVVTDSMPFIYGYRVSASAPYQFADSNHYNFAGFDYQGNVQTSISNSGLLEFGIMTPRTAYSIHSITTGLLDSFIIASQNMLYTIPRTKIIFPTTIGTSWSSIFHSDLNIYLTYLLLGDTLAPGIIRTYTIERDSVIGWGKMSVKNSGGIASPFLDVLQVQTIITHIDSFFLNGIPSNIFVDIFNVTQGQKDTIYEQNFYRQSEVTPLAQVEFRDAAFTQPFKATTHIQRLLNVGVNEPLSDTKWKVYPNPVCSGQVFIDLPTAIVNPDFELINMDGQMVLSGPLPSTKKTACLEIPGTVAPGIYTLKVHTNGSPVLSTQINIMK